MLLSTSWVISGPIPIANMLMPLCLARSASAIVSLRASLRSSGTLSQKLQILLDANRFYCLQNPVIIVISCITIECSRRRPPIHCVLHHSLVKTKTKLFGSFGTPYTYVALPGYSICDYYGDIRCVRPVSIAVGEHDVTHVTYGGRCVGSLIQERKSVDVIQYRLFVAVGEI